MTQIEFDAATAKAVEHLYLTPDVVAQRARVLDLLAPLRGESVLDIGVGPGLLAYDVARLVGDEGRVSGLDNAPAMLGLARARLAPLAHAECIEGDATALPFPDATFDAAVSTQVYEYVKDMPRALGELRRVLKPGARTLILDTDWRSIVWHSSDPKRMDRMLSVWDDHLSDPHLPARLGPLLTNAGFTVRRVEVIPMLTPAWQPVSYAGGITRTIMNFVKANAARHGIGADEVNAWVNDQQSIIAQDEFFFSLNRYVFIATRAL